MTFDNGRTWTKIALAAVAGLLLAAPAGAATQMDASDTPEVSGELTLEDEICERNNEKYQGEVVARGKACLRIYSFAPTAETDSDRNYGVAWLQSNVNSRRGWCASNAVSDLILPETHAIESRAPHSMKINRKKMYETVLAPDAGGNASETAEETSISQSQILYPQSLRTWTITDTNVVRMKWKGLRDEKLGFASGLELSWPTGERGGVKFGLIYELQRGTC